MKKVFISLVLGVSYIFAAIDINHASVEELTKLKGIGTSKAQAIVSYIEQNGCFKELNDLKAIKGIGESTISKNINEIKISPCKDKNN